MKTRWINLQRVFLALITVLCFTAKAEEVSIPHGQLTLNANLEIAEGSKIEDGIVLIVHGFMAHNRMEIIEKSQATFIARKINSLAINLSLGVDNRRGFFDCFDPINFKLSDALDELDLWTKWLKRKNVNRLFLMGHSISANQVLTYAVKRPALDIVGLILLAPNTQGFANSPKRYEDKFGINLEDALTEATQLVEQGKEKQLMEGVDFARCPMSTVTAETFYTFYRQDNPFWNAHLLLPKLDIPVLIIAASLDERQPNIQKHVKPYIDNTRVFLNVIDQSNHFFKDLNIEKAVAAAGKFVKTISTSK